MSEPVLREERDGAVVTLTLNRPAARNALSGALRAALSERFTALRGDDEVGVVILTGAGPAFCAGLDLKELGAAGPPPEAAGGTDTSGANLIDAIAAFDRPIVGAINGVAITGGFELALACDVLIGSSEARFADTHARVGILPGWGLSQKLPRLIGSVRAKCLSLTGNFLNAEEAERWGLLARVVEPEALLPTCRVLADDILSCVPEAVRGYKRVIDEGLSLSLGEALRHERRVAAAHAKSVTADQIAARRQAIQARGRDQSGD